jgi:thiol-disulfide isomerase/thioredoxin
MSNRFTRLSICLVVAAVMASSARAENKEKSEAYKAAEKRFAKLVAPEKKEASVGEFTEFIAEVRLNRPRSMEEMYVLQSKIKQAADAMKVLIENKDSVEYKEAVVDSLTAGSLIIPTLDKSAQGSHLEAVMAYLKKQDLALGDVRMAMTVCQGLEKAESYKLAATAYQEFSGLFEEAGLTRYAKAIRSAGAKVKLIGNRMIVRGVDFEGEEFDLKSLEGKVVLVDFWAPWCGPRIAEYPNMLKNYKQYKSKGFEIVGISLDQDRDALAKYLENKKVPWVTLHDEKHPGKHDAVEKYGITGIPAMFLINRKGRVISINARGDSLDRLLKAELGGK